MLPMLAGANMIYGPGMLESGLTMDLGQVVADADFIRMMQTVLNGIPVSDDTLVVDLIKEVGIKGQYLGEMHTFQNFKALQSCPRIMDRNAREVWETNGSKDMYAAASDYARFILETHKPQILSDDKLKAIHDIVEKAEKDIVRK